MTQHGISVSEEEIKVEKIKEVMSENQRRCDEDLARAEPAVRQAEAALDTLNKVAFNNVVIFPRESSHKS